MKKKLLFVLMLLAAMCNTAYAAPNLSLSSFSPEPGQPVSVDLSVSSTSEPYSGINARIIVPSCVTVTGVNQGTLLSGGDFFLDYWTFDNLSEQGVAVVAYSDSDTFSTDGILLSLDLQIGLDCSGQNYGIAFDTDNDDPLIRANHAVANADGSLSLSHLVTDGSLAVSATYADTDQDSMSDLWEQHHFQTSDHDGSADSDGDGLSDLEEFLLSTNPNAIDSDGDGMPDGWEVLYGLNPNVNDADQDLDRDGISNRAEYQNGTVPILPGDVNTDTYADLGDLILVIRLLAGVDVEVHAAADSNGDGLIGTAEAIFLLQTISGQ